MFKFLRKILKRRKKIKIADDMYFPTILFYEDIGEY